MVLEEVMVSPEISGKLSILGEMTGVAYPRLRALQTIVG